MTQAAMTSKVTVFGHRGARGIYPENTMAGFRYLCDIGVHAVEIDVQNAAGRVPVVAHDPYIAAALTKGRDGQWVEDDQRPILHISPDELAELSVGMIRPATNYAERFPDQARLPNEHIPTFEVFCEWAASAPSLLVNVEIKSHAMKPEISDPPGILAEDVIYFLQAHGLMNRSLISSFDWRVLQACKDRAPELKRGYLTLAGDHGTEMEPNIIDGSPWMAGAHRADHGNSLPQTVSDLGGRVWCPFFLDLTAESVSEAQGLGLKVNAWTVNEIDDIKRMINMGVDGVISDYPARVQNILAARNIC